MKTLYLECEMGAAGDMLTAALLELIPDQNAFIDGMNRLGIPGVKMKKELTSKCGINGTHIIVTVDGQEEKVHDHQHEHQHEHHPHDHEHKHTHDHQHEQEHQHTQDHQNEHVHQHSNNGEHSSCHRGMQEIKQIIEKLKLSSKVQANVLAVYALIAEAESVAHGVPVSEIHFHEIGTMDAIADITAVCLLMDKIAPQQVIVSPVHVGSGHVHCDHGILPVPAPATAYILRDVPIYGGAIKGELCTPTGAALLKHFATSFGNMPVMKTKSIGYGMGKKDFEAANCVRAFLGETEGKSSRVVDLNCNIDDMTAEEISFAMDRIFDSGALEVFTVAAGMKKSRLGTLIHVLCHEEDKDEILMTVFKYTSTIGVRETLCNRYVLERKITTIDTPHGEVRRKDSIGYGVKRSKYEYDDLARIAKEKGMSLSEVIQLIEKQ